MSVEAELEEQRKINRALLEENKALRKENDELESELDHGCDEPCCVEGWDDPRDVAGDVGDWLTRQKTLGLISPEGAATVERLLEDLS